MSDRNSKRVYSGFNEAVNEEVVTALGDYIHDYDVDGIGDEILEYYNDVDENGVENLNGSGFRLKPNIDDDAFWQIVEEHDISGKN